MKVLNVLRINIKHDYQISIRYPKSSLKIKRATHSIAEEVGVEKNAKMINLKVSSKNQSGLIKRCNFIEDQGESFVTLLSPSL